VLSGVGLSIMLYVVRQSNRVEVKQRVYDADGSVRESDPPAVGPGGTVLVLQPYGSLFFASATTFESALPSVEAPSSNSVVILRLRGRSDLGGTFMGVLRRYAQALNGVGSKLVLVSANDQMIDQLRATRVLDVIGDDDVYPGDEWVGHTVRRARDDALEWIDGNRSG